MRSMRAFTEEEVEILLNSRICEKPKTYADLIRSSSDEELAEFLGQYFTCEYECPAAKDGCSRDCNGTIMEWLQSEVEE